MVELITLVIVASLLTGVAIGWYLRRINAWCPHCGAIMNCSVCGSRPTWSSPGRTRPPAAR